MRDRTAFMIRREFRTLGQMVATVVMLVILFRLGVIAYEGLFGLS